jgi:hypothetical protein
LEGVISFAIANRSGVGNGLDAAGFNSDGFSVGTAATSVVAATTGAGASCFGVAAADGCTSIL